MTNGQIAYEAFYDHVCGKSPISGQPLATWCDFPDAVKAAWEAAGSAVLSQPLRSDDTDLAELVAAMRHAQRDYFRLRSPAVLQHAKKLERRVDDACRSALSSERQGELFA